VPVLILVFLFYSATAFLLDNGMLYHAANGTALVEYLLTLYFWPSFKSFPYLSLIGRADYPHISGVLSDTEKVASQVY